MGRLDPFYLWIMVDFGRGWGKRPGTGRVTTGCEIPLRNRPVYQAVEHPA
jgi:hypothetical protein